MKGQTIGTQNNLDESSENYAKWKKPNPQLLYGMWFQLYNILEIIKL